MDEVLTVLSGYSTCMTIPDLQRQCGHADRFQDDDNVRYNKSTRYLCECCYVAYHSIPGPGSEYNCDGSRL